ncbi:MAG TPA: hypothetical protein VN924_00755 [Bryobacteraceae bacterium]|nr:hypothetical protein [Bryobacteraceae bacterium]
MRRYLVAAILLACIAAEPALAARRRGAKLYPFKETTVDMSGMNRILLGWVDLKEDDWAVHGYSTKVEWASEIPGLNAALTGFCRSNYLIGKTVVGAKDKGDENAAGYDLYIKFSDVSIDYNKYHLYLSIHFIDPKTNAEIGSIPARPYFGNDWGFVNYLRAALEEVAQKIGVEVSGVWKK